MNEPNTSGQARKGLLDWVKGKLKEVAGAVTGNDTLTEQGQLQREQARVPAPRGQRHRSRGARTDRRRRRETGDIREAAVGAHAAVGQRAAAAEETACDVQQSEHRAAEQHTERRVAEETDRADTVAQVEAAGAQVDARPGRCGPQVQTPSRPLPITGERSSRGAGPR